MIAKAEGGGCRAAVVKVASEVSGKNLRLLHKVKHLQSCLIADTCIVPSCERTSELAQVPLVHRGCGSILAKAYAGLEHAERFHHDNQLSNPVRPSSPRT